jgi:hypothetical protein
MGRPADNQAELTSACDDLTIVVILRRKGKKASVDPSVKEVLSRLSDGGKEYSIVTEEELSEGLHSAEETRRARDLLAMVDYARRMQFKTTDVVEIVCSDWRGPYWLQVAGLSPIKARVRGFVVLKILAERAVSNPGEYISCTDMIPMIQKTTSGIKNRLGGPLWNNPIEGDIHKEISILRRKIGKRGGNPNVIEVSRGHGYRFSTPFFNVRLSLPDTEHSPVGEV